LESFLSNTKSRISLFNIKYPEGLAALRASVCLGTFAQKGALRAHPGPLSPTTISIYELPPDEIDYISDEKIRENASFGKMSPNQ
jgi:hypothetical protein